MDGNRKCYLSGNSRACIPLEFKAPVTAVTVSVKQTVIRILLYKCRNVGALIRLKHIICHRDIKITLHIFRRCISRRNFREFSCVIRTDLQTVVRTDQHCLCKLQCFSCLTRPKRNRRQRMRTVDQRLVAAVSETDCQIFLHYRKICHTGRIRGSFHAHELIFLCIQRNHGAKCIYVFQINTVQVNSELLALIHSFFVRKHQDITADSSCLLRSAVQFCQGERVIIDIKHSIQVDIYNLSPG